MAEPPKGQRCDGCRYSERQPSSSLLCLRYPPVQTRNSIGFRWPETQPHWWCGEYAPANPETIDDAAVTLARFVLLGDRTAARALADKLREE